MLRLRNFCMFMIDASHLSTAGIASAIILRWHAAAAGSSELQQWQMIHCGRLSCWTLICAIMHCRRRRQDHSAGGAAPAGAYKSGGSSEARNPVRQSYWQSRQLPRLRQQPRRKYRKCWICAARGSSAKAAGVTAEGLLSSLPVQSLRTEALYTLHHQKLWQNLCLRAGKPQQ